MKDLGFPVFSFEKNASYKERGLSHGEQFKKEIKELLDIRFSLIKERRPDFSGEKLNELANLQFEKTKQSFPDIFLELEGIKEAAGLTVLDIIVLNNYTDFRDIEFKEEGCSTLSIKRDDRAISSFTWDMHGSAINYILLLDIPETESTPAAKILSHVGCIGMSGFNSSGNLVTINNLNTIDTKPAPIWPAAVRKILEQQSLIGMREVIKNLDVGGGRNYLIADSQNAENWEVSPSKKVLLSSLQSSAEIFHTNHILSPELKELEIKSAVSSTTHNRHQVLDKNLKNANTLSDVKALILNHDGEPKSICSHYQSSSQDPSKTCAACVVDFKEEKAIFWRGCDKNLEYKVEHSFNLKQDS